MSNLHVIDDEPGTRAFIEAVALSQSLEVHTSGGAREFFDAIREFPPDAIILDLCMPDVDGIELMRGLAEADCKASIALVSGFDGRVLDAAKRLGEARGLRIVAALTKPIRLATMREVLSKLSV